MVDGNGTEAKLARLEQKVHDLDARVTSQDARLLAMVAAMTPVNTSLVQMTERMETLRRDVKDCDDHVSKISAGIERRETQQIARLEEERKEREARAIDVSKERRILRMALLGFSVTIFAALITATVTLLSQAL